MQRQNNQTWDYLLIPILWALIALILMPYAGGSYTNDSYQYYLLGKNLFTRHEYWAPVIRSNLVGETFYSRAFPPLMPILCGLAEFLFKAGIASGFIVNLCVLYGIFHLSYLIGKTACARFFYLIPIACFFFVLVNSSFTDELLSGRSIPLATLLFLALIYTAMISENLLPARSLTCGCCLGLMYLTRFDTSLFCLAFPLAFYGFRKYGVKTVLCMYFGLFAVISPWLLRNVLTFGTPFASNGSISVLSTYTGDPVFSFFKHGIALGVSDPGLWITERFACLRDCLLTVYMLITPFGLVPVLGGGVVIACVAAGLINGRNRAAFTLTSITLFWLVMNIATITLAQNLRPRYFSTSTLLLLLGAVAGMGSIIGKNTNIPALGRIPPLPAFLSVIVFFGLFTFEFPQIKRDTFRAHFEKMNADFAEFIGADEKVGYVYADQLAYYTPWKTICLPRNTESADENFIAWRQAFNVRYIIVSGNSEFLHGSAFRKLAVSGDLTLLDVRGM